MAGQSFLTKKKKLYDEMLFSDFSDSIAWISLSLPTVLGKKEKTKTDI